MSNHVEFSRLAATRIATIAAGHAVGVDVVVTADELITERARLFIRSKRLTARYRLGTLSSMKVSRRSPTGGQCAGCWTHCAACIPPPVASCLQLEFAGTSPTSLCLIFGADAQADFERIVSVLGTRLTGVKPGGRYRLFLPGSSTHPSSH